MVVVSTSLPTKDGDEVVEAQLSSDSPSHTGIAVVVMKSAVNILRILLIGSYSSLKPRRADMCKR
jgi:hypothetical protein